MKLIYTSRFKKDYKKIKKQNKDLQKLRGIIENLLDGNGLDVKFQDHELSGELDGHRNCHIEPDWILIYYISGDKLILERMGSHSDLFK